MTPSMKKPVATGLVTTTTDYKDFNTANNNCQEHQFLLAATAPKGADEDFRQRREIQRQKSIRIGLGEEEMRLPELFTKEQVFDRFVFLTDGSRVADIEDPRFSIAYTDFQKSIAASKYEEIKDYKPRLKQVSEYWLNSPYRKTATATTFKAGGSLFEPDPHLRDCINTWRPFVRSNADFDPYAHGLSLFLDHVQFLFKEDAQRFLCWLAHIEQKTGQLPHTAWLHVAIHTGLGRNWLAAVLVRVWFGRVAAHLDLNHLLEGSFNGVVSGKILGIVDEIREGAAGNQYRFFEQLKKLITEEQRFIRPKYGREYVEYNACRMLFFSNHRSAIPIDQEDRRFEVVISEDTPPSAEYFKKLYGALDDPIFIESVARYLGQLDISGFNAGDRAKQSNAKVIVQGESKTALDEAMDLIGRQWPSDAITTQQFASGLTEEGAINLVSIRSSAVRRTMERYGFKSLNKPIRVIAMPSKHNFSAKPERVIILRNHESYIDKFGNPINGAVLSAFSQLRINLSTAIKNHDEFSPQNKLSISSPCWANRLLMFLDSEG
jgi:hypothetical protein